MVTPEIIICKKEFAHEGAADRDILIHLLGVSPNRPNNLTYLRLIAVLVDGNSSPKSYEQDYLNCQQKL